VGNWINWLLLIGGIVFIIVELLLGALTGFDLLLTGSCLAAGGISGLIAHSERVGVIAAAVLAFSYFVFFRSWLRSRLQQKNEPSNVDAVVGRKGVVTKRIATPDAGLVKIGPEEWRAELAQPDGAAREIGAEITVVSVEGVTLKVR
jgi:membrane protein implicated in regulation of membrane protease activity